MISINILDAHTSIGQRVWTTSGKIDALTESSWEKYCPKSNECKTKKPQSNDKLITNPFTSEKY